MALFKFRKGGDESVAAAPQPESVEALRRRARHRLIGAAVLVLIGVIGFPLVFDTQPRPIAVDIPIEIPDRNKVKPLAPPPAAPVAQAPATSGPVGASPACSPAAAIPAASVAAAPSPKSEPQPAVITESRTEAKVAEAPKPPPPKPEPPKVEAKAEPKPAPAAPKRDDAGRAQALLEGKAVDVTDRSAQPAAAEGRFIVQVGAFADVAKARETRLKVEHAGLKTYTQVTETKDGKRIRVRVGPFATRAEAERAAQKIKGLDLPAAILTL